MILFNPALYGMALVGCFGEEMNDRCDQIALPRFDGFCRLAIFGADMLHWCDPIWKYVLFVGVLNLPESLKNFCEQRHRTSD